MTKLFDCQVAELLQNAGKQNPEIRALSYAILQEKRRIMEKALRTRTMAMIDDLTEEILDVLAVELRTPAYDENFPIETKRALIKGTLAFYAKLGTPEAVNWVIRTVFGNGEIEEWFRYGGEPHHFRVTVQNDGTFSSLDGLADFLRLVAMVKRLSSWLDAITVETDLGPQALRIGGTMASITRLPLPELADSFSFEATLCTGGQMAAIHRRPVPELADSFMFSDTLRTGGCMASSHRIPIPEDTSIALSCTGRVGVRGAVTVTVPLPEITSQ